MAVDDELQRYLAGLSKKVRTKLTGVIKDEADALSAAQRGALQSLETAPDETGHLEASCVAVPGGNEAEFIVRAGGEMTTDARGYDHALSFEYGTQKQPARPFFWSTYNVRKRGIRENINKAIEEALK